MLIIPHGPIPEDLPSDYFSNSCSQASRLFTIKVSRANCAMDEVGEVLGRLIPFVQNKRKERPQTPRTGKPEEPFEIAYTLMADTLQTNSQDDRDSPEHLLNAGRHFSSYRSHDHWSTQETDQKGQLKYFFPVSHLYLSDYWQLYPLYKHPMSYLPQRMVTTGGISHPLRPPQCPPCSVESSDLYTRSIPSIGTTISFKLADPHNQHHLQVFHEWHNSDRVNAFWGERGSLEHHSSYMRKQWDDPHVTPVLGFFDGVAFGYFELYWAAEDAIGTFAHAGPYDAGWHALVGSQAHRGPDKVRAWISSVTHYLFLRDLRTQRVMLEPRVDNDKFLGYLTQHGYSVEKEFNFPHKRAALVSITREKFFETQGIET